MRAAILRGHRPTYLIRDAQPDSKWNRLDRRLALAFQIHTDEISNNTGMPYWVTRSLDPDLILVVDSRVDVGEAALDRWDRDHSGDKRKDGTSRFLVAQHADDTPFDYGGVTRQQFQQAAIQEAQDREDEIDVDRERPPEGYDPAEYGDGLTTPA